ncbi:autophagy protein [Yamadazyma tenuis]|uniref:WD40 repeat-like protein n=1 Tax=Candida tenuis (strain ATCC 10573 / BCRC 21748 / CBS 615 / JCM 9827 / NBRC 10315 / NRRL Y-1498 / VKM Y-70) TaxID=590646 RepID=G3AYI0_CANTC|nr:WD40 repeat-like protein [Yamadazyma tenuis ATCC 10573]EGV65855.1 WD40 repeat-like protein [Yamadazyma tenuis ATCC 10573]WEJ95814.1 autophagy protein [Yamadazyma tenuis]
MMKNSLNTGLHPPLYSNYNNYTDDGNSSIASSGKYSHLQGKEPHNQVNYITFNQDNTFVAVGLNTGYKVFNCVPSVEKCYQDVKNEPIGLVEMLYNTSLVALVGLGEDLGSSPRKLKIINSKKNSTICDLVFPSTILGIKLSKQRLVVLLETQIYIYDISTMKLLHTIETSPNPNGLFAFANTDMTNSPNTFLAYPSPPKTIIHDTLLVNGINTNGGNNSVQNNIQSVSNSPNRVGDVIIFNTITLQPLSVIEAHKSNLAALTLSNDGTLLATASDKGTIIRVFNVLTGVKMFQFRRGTYSTKIFSLKFSNDNVFIVVTTSSGTVHIFRLGEEESLEAKHKNKRKKKTPLINEPTIEEENEEEDAESKRATKMINSKTNDTNDDEIDVDDNEPDDDEIRDDGDDSDAEDGIDEVDEDAEQALGLDIPKQRKLSESSTGSFTSIYSGLSNEDIPSLNNGGGGKSEPIVDQTRLSMARIIRRSSQTLGRKAAQKMGDFLPSRFSSILEPTRHFASIKINSIGKDVKAIAAMNNELQEDLVPQQYLTKNSENKDIEIEIDKSKDLLNMKLLHINVVTSEGISYTYGLDPERGGDCILLHQYSLLD